MIPYLCLMFSVSVHCPTSDCHIVKNISQYAPEHGRMFSPRGRNAVYCSLQSNFSVDNISGLKFYAGKLV